MPPNYVKAYVKRNKHDVADAEAICEAVRRPSMRFVPLKTAEQQSALMMHRARDLLIRQRTMLVNALRGHLAEFGLIEAQGLHKVARLITIVMDESGRARTGNCPSGAEGDRQPDRRYPDTDRRARKAGSRMAQEQSSQPTSRHHPRDRADHRHGDRRDGCRSEYIPQWQRVCRLARASADDKTLPVAKRASVELANEGTVISAACSSTAHTRCCFARRQAKTDPWLIVPAQPKATACRGSRFGEQDGTRGLGDHEQTGHLPTRSSGSMTC